MVRLYKDPEGKHVFIEDKLTGGTRNTLSLHTVSSTDREIDKLRKQISELEKKIARERVSLATYGDGLLILCV